MVNLPDCTDLCNRLKIERVSMPSKLSVFQLRPFARSAWHYHRIVMHSNFLAGSPLLDAPTCEDVPTFGDVPPKIPLDVTALYQLRFWLRGMPVQMRGKQAFGV